MRIWELIVLAFLMAVTLHFHHDDLASILQNAGEAVANPPQSPNVYQMMAPII